MRRINYLLRIVLDWSAWFPDLKDLDDESKRRLEIKDQPEQTPKGFQE